MKSFTKQVIAAIVLSQLAIPVADAVEVYMPAEAKQGETIIIEVPDHDISTITGSLDGHEIKFYKSFRNPKPEEPITRAEFLELMFINGDFDEVDTSGTTDFPDVPADSPYYHDIKKAQALGIIHGYTDGKFHPHATITRGQAAKILVEAFDPPVTLESSELFADVPNNHRFFNYVSSAVGMRWFRGYPDGLMRPDRQINFLEAEIVIKRAAVPEVFYSIGEKSYYKAYAGVHRLTSPGIKKLDLNITTPYYDAENRQETINVTSRWFPTVSFSLSKEKTDLFGDDYQKKTWDAVYGAMANPTQHQLWEGNFIEPTAGVITLGFGDKLYINGNYSGSHFGIDYANDGGTEIYAPNAGRVTLAESTPSFGETIVIDHGHNVFTMYLHLSELKVAKYDMVEQGDLIGLMGTTGISSGDHLHYTHFIGDVIVDPDQWILNPP